MSDLTELRCFNPVTGKRDGGYCVWEGKGKCLKCEAAERIAELEAENERVLKLAKVRGKMMETLWAYLGTKETPIEEFSQMVEWFDDQGRVK